MKKYNLTRVTLGLTLAIISLITYAAEPLRIATEGAYPPFNEVDASGKPVGFDVEIAVALCEEMNRECEIVAQDWDGIIPGLVNNKYEAIVASMSITEERMKSIDFSDPYYSNYIAIVGPKGTDVTLENLASKTIGAQRSTVASEWVEEKVGARGKVNLYDTQTAANADLSAGRTDALVSDYLPAVDWLKSNEGFGIIGEKIDIKDKIGVGIRKDAENLKNEFNKAIAAIRTNGKYLAISEKYFGVDIF